jgi:hypothetical protein
MHYHKSFCICAKNFALKQAGRIDSRSIPSELPGVEWKTSLQERNGVDRPASLKTVKGCENDQRAAAEQLKGDPGIIMGQRGRTLYQAAGRDVSPKVK